MGLPVEAVTTGVAATLSMVAVVAVDARAAVAEVVDEAAAAAVDAAVAVAVMASMTTAVMLVAAAGASGVSAQYFFDCGISVQLNQRGSSALIDCSGADCLRLASSSFP